MSCDDGAEAGREDGAKMATELDMAAINVDVNGPTVPLSTKAGRSKVPKLNLPGALEEGKAAKPETPTGKSARENLENMIHLPTMHESDFVEDPMNLGHMTTTGNVSHDSASMRDAEQKFRDLLAGGEADDEQKDESHTVSLIETESEASPEKILRAKADAAIEEAKDIEGSQPTISINLKPTEHADKDDEGVDIEDKKSPDEA